MLMMAIQSQAGTRESVERKPWTSQDGEVCVRRTVVRTRRRRDLPSTASVWASRTAPMVASFAVWSFLKSQIASAEW